MKTVHTSKKGGRMRRVLIASLALAGLGCLSRNTVRTSPTSAIDAESDSVRAHDARVEAAKVRAVVDSLVKTRKKTPPI